MSFSESYHQYLLTPKWKAKAARAIKRAGNRCQVCGNIYNLHVHHNTYRNLGNEKPEDLCVLCSRCHGVFHGIIPDIGRHFPQRPSRIAVREATACPTCGAAAGELCLRLPTDKHHKKHPRREANHVARVNAYLES